MKLESFVRGQWTASGADLIDVRSAVTGDTVAVVPSGGLEMSAILSHARSVGGPALRRLTFHQRADMLKRLAQYLTERKDELYKLSLLDRRHAHRRHDRRRRRHRHPVRLRRQGTARTAERDIPARRRGRTAWQGRHVRGPAYRRGPPRRRGAYHSVQFSLLGAIGEIVAGAARRRSGGDQARHRDVLRRARADAHDRGRPASCPTARCSSSWDRPATCSTT